MAIGRPTKFKKEYIDPLIRHIENGANYRRACILSGVSLSLFMEWKAKGLEDKENGIESQYVEFLERITLAKETYIAWLQQSVNKTAEIDGKFALEVLARKLPQEFGKKDRLQLTGKIESEIDSTLTVHIVTNEAELKE